MNLPQPIMELVDTAIVREHRRDPALPRTGGPAGNAQLTAWIGLLLLVLLAAELLTLLDVSHFITWHIAVGVLLIPPAIVKTASTGWRILRYYTGARPYRSAGPPPIVLRLLGPLVVLTTLGVLGSGLALIAIGPQATFRPWFAVLGHGVSPLTLHQGFFLAFGVVTGVHILARLLPAARLAVGSPTMRRLDGLAGRVAVVLLALASGAVAAVVALNATGSWPASH